MYVTGGAFQAWATFLESWADGGPAEVGSLPVIDRHHFAGDSWARLTDRITAALDRRLATWSGVLAREFSAARDEFTAARALHHARWELAPIRAVAAATALPDEMRDRLTGMVDTQIRGVQDQLEKHIERMRRSGTPRAAVEARLRTVRDNPLTGVLTAAPAPGPAAGWAADPTVTPRRRVTLD